MKRFAILILSVMPGAAIAAPPVIGTVTAGGAFRLNGDTVIGNGTLTEGAWLETGPDVSSVRLTGGARMSLNPDSRGQMYGDRLILEKGEARLENGAGFHLEALTLTIRPDRGSSTGRIGLLGRNRLRVAALTGSFRVLNARGVLVANVPAGAALAFEPLATAALTHITGTLMEQRGHFLLKDQITQVTAEVAGQGLSDQVGHVVDVTGTLIAGATPVAGATQVIAARQVRAMAADAAKGHVREGAVAAGIAGALGTAVSANSIAVVGGVAAVASVEGIAAGSSADPAVTPPGQPPGRPPDTPPEQPPGQPPERPPATPPGLSR